MGSPRQPCAIAPPGTAECGPVTRVQHDCRGWGREGKNPRRLPEMGPPALQRKLWRRRPRKTTLSVARRTERRRDHL